MNDPHVVALLYRVDHGKSVSYQDAEPLLLDEPAFRLEVKDGQARFELKEHYATQEDALKSVEDYIQNWEFDASLESGPGSFRLKFQKAEIVDRNPTPGVINLRATIRSGIPTVSATLTLGFRSFPSPPSDFSLLGLRDLYVRTMFDRYMNYRRRRALLTEVAYFCLTRLEYIEEKIKRNKESNRKAASRYFQIDMKVLKEIGRLSSTKGGPSGARKGEGVSDDLTNEESLFLEEAIKKMIRRAAKKAHNPDADLPKTSLSDLPPI